MSTEPETREDALPEPTEQVHLPEPSYLPVATAFGITLLLVGVVLTWILSIIGGIIFIVAVVRWIRETRQDIAKLPLEH
jgi:heme/copper-type cytochrome/quinol oxidase subunit 1